MKKLPVGKYLLYISKLQASFITDSITKKTSLVFSSQESTVRRTYVAFYANNFTLETRQKQEEQRQAAIKISSLLLSLQACMLSTLSSHKSRSRLTYVRVYTIVEFELKRLKIRLASRLHSKLFVVKEVPIGQIKRFFRFLAITRFYLQSVI